MSNYRLADFHAHTVHLDNYRSFFTNWRTIG